MFCLPKTAWPPTCLNLSPYLFATKEVVSIASDFDEYQKQVSSQDKADPIFPASFRRSPK